MSKFIVRLEQFVACCLASLLIVPVTEAANPPLPSTPQPQLIATQSQPAVPDAGSPQSAPQDQQPSSSATQQNSQTQPVGTAVAPVLKPEGNPGSRPAGAAIAPAKQRRVRRFTIRVALLVGAGIAIGTVAAASLGSPSHPH
ncbi:MAG: hypothetical protein WA294_06400 [Acidobacteriaceae bacterium]